MQRITKAILLICAVLCVAMLVLYIAYLQKPVLDSEQQQSFSDFVGEAFKLPKQQTPKLPIKTAIKRNDIAVKENQLNKHVQKISCEIARSSGTWTDISSNAKQREDNPAKTTAATTKTGKFTSCYDADGNNLQKASAVYYFDYLSAPTYIGYSYKQAPLDACKVLADKCKTDGLPSIYEAYCDQKGTAKYKEIADDCRKIFGNKKYTCVQGRCVLPEKKQETEEQQPENPEQPQQPEQPIVTEENQKKPDLVVDTIYPTIYGKQCVNSYYFKICNNGDATVDKPFAITVTVNGISSGFTYFPAEFAVLAPAECIDIIKPEKLTILKFSVALQSTSDVTVLLDTNNEIAETDETNNQKTAAVYSGNGYIYDPLTYDPENEQTWCDSYCYDSDDSKNYGKEGAVLFKYKSYISTEQDYCFGQNEIQTQLVETYCKQIVKYENTGKFSNPLGTKVVDCTLLNTEEQQYKCEQNKCVPCAGGKCWYATNGIEPGKEEICKEILLVSSDETNQEGSEGGGGGGSEGINEPEADPFVKGNNDLCTDSNYLKDSDEPPVDTDSLPSNVVEAYCADTGEKIGGAGGSSSGELSDFEKFIKDLLGDYVPNEPSYYDCSDFSTPTQKYACIDGKCVAVAEDKESCQGPTLTQLDAYTADKIIHTTVLGDQEQEKFDWCADYGDSVVQVYCDGKKWKTKVYGCTKDDAVCIDDGFGGRCVLPDPNKKKCDEFNDLGFDYEQHGWIIYTTEYGITDTKVDSCVNDDQLVEYYCEGKENKFTVPFSCNSLGKKCVNGACV